MAWQRTLQDHGRLQDAIQRMTERSLASRAGLDGETSGKDRIAAPPVERDGALAAHGRVMGARAPGSVAAPPDRGECGGVRSRGVRD